MIRKQYNPPQVRVSTNRPVCLVMSVLLRNRRNTHVNHNNETVVFSGNDQPLPVTPIYKDGDARVMVTFLCPQATRNLSVLNTIVLCNYKFYLLFVLVMVVTAVAAG